MVMEKKTKRKKITKIIKKIVFIYLIAILLINLVGYGLLLTVINELYEDGLYIKTGTKLFLFVHGNYGWYCDDLSKQGVWEGQESLPCDKAIIQHYMTINGKFFWTREFIINEYITDDINYIWGTWCGAGNSEYIYFTYYNETGYNYNDFDKWSAYNIKKNKLKGDTYPVFLGFGFVLL